MNQPEGQHSGAASVSQPWLNLMGSRHLLDWLGQKRVSLAFTTYQTGKLFFVGRKPNQAISVFERTDNHYMGMWATPDARTIWLSSRFQISRLESATATAVPYQPVESDEEATTVPPWTEWGDDIAYVLRAVPDSGLWLLKFQPQVVENLRCEAGRRSVESNRLVFADIVSKPEHLARHRLADLFLVSSHEQQARRRPTKPGCPNTI